MSMYDDLDPMFTPSAEAALEKVAVRVHALRMRRRVTIASALSTVVVVTALASAAFASGGNDRPRVSVNEDVTSTTETTTTEPNRTTTTSVADETTTTVESSPTTDSSAPPSNGGAPDGSVIITDPPPGASTTTLPPADLHFAFDRDRLVIQSGTSATISYTVTNEGDGPGTFFEPGCPVDAVWVGVPSWPAPANGRVYCQSAIGVTVGPHESRTFTHTVVAGLHDGANDRVVPSAPGTTTYDGPEGHRLPVTITAPAQLPFGSTFPAHVTVASGAAHTETFTLTNRLPFAVTYELTGPCMRPVGATTACFRTAHEPLKALWHYVVNVGPNATMTLEVDLSATNVLRAPGPDTHPLPPGTYHFQGPGEMPLTLTVTP